MRFLPAALLLALASGASAHPAFPGCEGFGCETQGGRGGRILAVTSLADSGTGTLRAALATTGPRIVVFRIAGFITLQSPITVVEPFLTVAGQTAPGSGVTIRNKLTSDLGLAADSFTSLVVTTHDVVVQHLAIRPGVWHVNPACTGRNAIPNPNPTGSTCVDAGDVQAVEINYPAHHVVLDHLSLSHSTDETIDLGGATDVTVQWSIISDGYRSYPYCGHFGTCDAWGGKGAQVGDTVTAAAGHETTRLSWHHNLWAHTAARLPQLVGVSDVRENIAYNWREHGADIHNLLGETKANYVGNTSIPGLDTKRVKNSVMAHDWACGSDAICTGAPLRFFTDAAVNCVRYTGTVWQPCVLSDYQLEEPVAAPPVTVGGDVLAWAGSAVRLGATGHVIDRRDSIDVGVVANVRNGTGRAPVYTTPISWPPVVSGQPYADTDNDGMADEWERENGLNVGVNDSGLDLDGDGWTNIEEFLATEPSPAANGVRPRT